jgi:hypothetical protein
MSGRGIYGLNVVGEVAKVEMMEQIPDEMTSEAVSSMLSALPT